MTEQQTLSKIHEVFEQLKPVIARDGGNIEFVKYEGTTVYVKLLGACVSCPASMFTLQLGVQEALQAQIPEITDVVAVD